MIYLLLLMQLDSNDFLTREHAQAQLTRSGPVFAREAVVCGAVNGSLEVTKRCERIFQQWWYDYGPELLTEPDEVYPECQP
jgi:hypothetical protein